jgi:hypothetical protein
LRFLARPQALWSLGQVGCQKVRRQRRENISLKSFCRLKFVRKEFVQIPKLADESLADARQCQVSVASTVTGWLFRLQP